MPKNAIILEKHVKLAEFVIPTACAAAIIRLLLQNNVIPQNLNARLAMEL